MILHLVRHGETLSYDRDAGLTELGRQQAADRGRALAAGVGDGEFVGLRCAPTLRALETAEVLRDAVLATAAEQGRAAHLDPPVTDAEFRNLSVWVDERSQEPTQVRAALAAHAGTPDGEAPGWVTEARRFWHAHDVTGDAMRFWLTTPLLSHEPPAHVVARFLRAGLRLADGGRRQVVVATHSGCLRALVAWAAGADLGEPDNAETVTLQLDGGRALIGYRGQSWSAAVAPPTPW